MKKLILISVVLLVYSNLSLKAQVISDLLDPSFQNSSILSSKVESAKGSIFLNDSWQDGILYSNRQEIPAKLKYDAYNGLIYTVMNGVESPINAETIKSFTIGDKKFVKFGNLFYEIIMDGNYKLLSYHKIILKENNAAKNSGYGSAKHNQSELVHNETYYIAKDETLYEVKNKKSLNEISPAFTEVASKTKTKVKDKESLKELIEKVNTEIQ